MSIRNMRGPRQDPCGVPYSTSCSLLTDSLQILMVLHFTLKVRLVRQLSNQANALPLILYSSNFFSSMLCSIVSKALERSNSMQAAYCLFSSILTIVPTTCPMACSQL